jgi:hypothetical protein
VPDRLGPGVGQAHPIEELVGPAAGGGLAQPVEPAEQDEVLAAAENLVDGRLLAAEADPPPDLVGGASHVGAGHHRPAAVGSQEGGEHPDRGRLAGAVRAEQAADGAGATARSNPSSAPVSPKRLWRPSASIANSSCPIATPGLLSTAYRV